MQQAQELNAELLSFHRWSLTLADLAYSLLRRLVRAWGDEEAAAICTHLVTGLGNKSLEVDCALRDLAQMEGTPAFESALSAFLAKYGHRSFSLDIYYPPFADDPEQVLGLLPGLRRERTGQGKDHSAAREASQRCLHLAIAHGPLGWLKWALFGHVLHIVQQYMPLREEQRFYWQKTLSLIRNLFLLLGKRMAEAGVLQDAQHIFLLTKDEIGGYVSSEARADAYAALAAIRQRQFASLRRQFDAAPSLSYPQFLCGNQPLTSGSAPCEHQFKGRAVSSGLARGRVVVLFSPASFNKVKPGDVLVTRSVDPGWTPIFGLLSGLVIEHGGQLSHGAVVAREYGLPTVAGISGITQWLHDGDIVIVDGLNGIVARVTDERGSISEDA